MMTGHLPNYKEHYRKQEIEKYYYTPMMKIEKIYTLEERIKELEIENEKKDKKIKNLSGIILDNKEAAVNMVSKAGLL